MIHTDFLEFVAGRFNQNLAILRLYQFVLTKEKKKKELLYITLYRKIQNLHSI